MASSSGNRNAIPREMDSVWLSGTVNSNDEHVCTRGLKRRYGRKGGWKEDRRNDLRVHTGQRKQMRGGIPFVTARQSIFPGDPVDQLYPRGGTPLHGGAWCAPQAPAILAPSRNPRAINANEKGKSRGEEGATGEKIERDAWKSGARIFACVPPLDGVTGNTVGKNMPVNRVVIRGGGSREIRLIGCSQDREPLRKGLLIAYRDFNLWYGSIKRRG